MSRLIVILSVAVTLFAGYTLWNDPVTGPRLRAMLPKELAGLPVISASNGEGADGRYGGIGAAGRVAGAVLGATGN